MDWLSGFGWPGLITVAVSVSVVWDIFFPLNNLLIINVYVISFIGWLILENLHRSSRQQTSLSGVVKFLASSICHVLLGAKPEKEPEAHHCERDTKSSTDTGV
ncbi:hypothetical protein Syncc9605_1724 [Synechococcus sp. CC9605]|nr:hypothetical protein Syncc9605_1724 [Synechococcus sp. CC9605]